MLGALATVLRRLHSQQVLRILEVVRVLPPAVGTEGPTSREVRAPERDDVIYVEGWAPPELVHDRPEEDSPLPLSKRALRIEEKYVVLGAIHESSVKA